MIKDELNTQEPLLNRIDQNMDNLERQNEIGFCLKRSELSDLFEFAFKDFVFLYSFQ